MLFRLTKRFFVIVLLVFCLGVIIFLPEGIDNGLNLSSCSSRSIERQGSLFFGEFAAIIADYCVLAAHHYWHQGKWYLMAPVYEIVIALQPLNIDYWSLLGWIYAFNTVPYISSREEKEAQIERGIRKLRQGLIYHPDQYMLYFDIAWIYFKQQSDYKSALELIAQAYKYDHPSSVERLYTLILFRLGHEQSALNIWKTYLQSHPDDQTALKELKRLEECIYEKVAA